MAADISTWTETDLRGPGDEHGGLAVPGQLGRGRFLFIDSNEGASIVHPTPDIAQICGVSAAEASARTRR